MLDNRPDHPIKSEIFVKLVSEHELRKSTIKNFYKLVDQYSPEGMLTSYAVKDPQDNPTSVSLIHRVDENGKHEYEIPLARNLTSDEIYKIVEQLDISFNEGDFLFETSTWDDGCCIAEEDDEDEYLESGSMEVISEQVSQRLHDKWMQERLHKGWRYGELRSDEEKTHPLIKPWNQLSEEFRHIDYELPITVFELLEENGYTIISYDELNELLDSKIRK